MNKGLLQLSECDTMGMCHIGDKMRVVVVWVRWFEGFRRANMRQRIRRWICPGIASAALGNDNVELILVGIKWNKW